MTNCQLSLHPDACCLVNHVTNALVLLAIVLWSPDKIAIAQPATISKTADVPLEEKLPAADSPSTLRQIYRALFAPLNDDQIDAMQFDPNKEVGMQAAWEIVRRATNAEVKRIKFNQIPLDPLRVSRFSGFVEGRLKRPLPKWWEQGIAEGALEQVDDMLIPFDGKSVDDRPNPNVYIDEKYWVPRGMIFVEQIRPRFQLVGKDDRFEIPEELYNRVVKAGDWEDHIYLNALRLDKRRFLLTMHDAYPGPYKMFCLITSTKPRGTEPPAVEWETEIWTGYSPGMSHSGGVPEHWSTLVLDGEEVLVVGLCAEGAYIESFRLKDGKDSFRFSTSY